MWFQVLALISVVAVVTSVKPPQPNKDGPPRPAVCNMKGQTGHCTREYKPVCGTDFQTYTNECELCHQIYLVHHPGLQVLHDGKCTEKDLKALEDPHMKPIIEKLRQVVVP